MLQSSILPASSLGLLLLCNSVFLTPADTRVSSTRQLDRPHTGLARRALRTATSQPQTTQTSGNPIRTNPRCIPRPIAPSTWSELHVDEYLAKYPNGNSTNLQQFAASVGASNFVCGIGETCDAGQLCNPVESPAWDVLFAAQEWNNFQNKFFNGIESAIQSLIAISGSLVTDFFYPRSKNDLLRAFKGLLISASIIYGMIVVLSFVGGLAVLLAGIALLPPLLIGSGVTAIVQTYKEQFRTASSLELITAYSYFLNEWKQKAQQTLSNQTKTVLSSGISSPEGISSVLTNGNFYLVDPVVDQSLVADNVRKTTTVRLLTDILRYQRAFVTIASDKCDSKGPNGAWEGNNVLSYCSSNGTMFNIIRSGKHRVHNHWPNADLLSKKYNITTEYLTQQSYSCQLKHGTPNFDPYKIEAGLPVDLSSECLSNLPVCDFRKPELEKAKKDKNTIYACRHVAKLPI